MRQLYLILFLSSLLFPTLHAQRTGNHVPGEIIVQAQAEDLAAILTDLREINGRPTGFQRKESISQAMNAWLMTFDPLLIAEDRMLESVRRHPRVSLAQFNHYVNLRKEPNDPQFAGQWQHLNDGSSGTEDADVDSEGAWEITTGGLTANGDTIVICMLDDGIDLEHVDLTDNLWINKGEIPDNGLDDDNNGYIDDVYGWNEGDDNGNVEAAFFATHGTQVAGMAGARGDNGAGIAGVNWNVKIMTVVNGNIFVESEVLAAYSYPLWFRKRYNETQGAEGAFVVATNASWGIDFGQPEDSPLWCAFYDSLGLHGILSCGATANLNIDIDVEGDLPTGCPSDYLISVTSTDINDTKSGFSAFGANTIDLGAPGEDIFTTTVNDSYTTSSGTSFATPMVAGAIALLYSVPCSGLADLAKDDPAAAALLARDFLYAAVDPLPTLDGVTTTGGRLNLANSVMLASQACADCPTPIGLKAGTDIFSATLSWDMADSLSYILQWRETGAADWDTVPEATVPFVLEDLDNCTEYEFRIAAICPTGDTSLFSLPASFSTLGCCQAPEALVVFPDNNNFTLAWTFTDLADEFLVTLSPPDLSGDSTFSTTETQLPLALADCEEYTLAVQAVCPLGDTSTLSIPFVYTTGNCGVCTDLSYCPSEGGSDAFEWIESVSFNTLDNPSGQNGGYAFFQGLGTTLNIGDTYTLSVEPGFNGINFNENFLAWIDYNQNGQFDLPYEEILNINNDATVTTDVTIPAAALPGTTRMRVSMIFGSNTGPCTELFSFGEVEDYCVTIQASGSFCPPPSGLFAGAVDIFSATVGWDQNDGITYLLQYRPLGAPDWIDAGAVSSPFSLQDLDNCTEYEFRVAQICSPGSDTSAYSFPLSFATEGCCTVPSNLNDLLIVDSALVVNWQGDGISDLSYLVNISPPTLNGDSILVSESSLLAIQNLLPCTEYTISVQAVCVVGDTTEASAPITLLTKGCGPCVDLDYCNSVAGNANFEWIERVAIKDIDNSSGTNGGYAIFPDLNTTLVQDSTYDIILEPGYSDFESEEYFRVWIDFNQDGDFDPATELVYDPGATTTVPLAGSITIPEDAPLGDTRMRVSMRFFSPPFPCLDFSSGEVEDYCITIGPKFTPCMPPQDLAVVDSAQTSMLVDWTQPLESTIGFNLQFKPRDDTEWEDISTLSDMYLFSGLEFCTWYDLRVRTVCETDISDFSDTLKFRTLGCSVVHTKEVHHSEWELITYPNPFRDQLMVSLQLPESDQVSLYLFDLTGRALFRQTLGVLPPGKHLLEIHEAGQIPQGVYLLKVIGEKGDAMQKVVKVER